MSEPSRPPQSMFEALEQIAHLQAECAALRQERDEAVTSIRFWQAEFETLRQTKVAAEADVLRLQVVEKAARRMAMAGTSSPDSLAAVAALQAVFATTAPGGAPSKPTRAEVVALLAEGKRNADAACGPEDAAPPALPRVRFGAGGAPSPAPSAAEEPR